MVHAPPARMISTKPLSPILDPPWRQFIVLVVFANRLEMPRDCRIIGLGAGVLATRRDRVEPVHPIIRRLPLIIYNLSRFNVSPMFWSIFAIRLTRFVLWINRVGKYIYIYGQTDVIWKMFDIWTGEKQCCFLCLINFDARGKRESFSCLLNYCSALCEVFWIFPVWFGMGRGSGFSWNDNYCAVIFKRAF